MFVYHSSTVDTTCIDIWIIVHIFLNHLLLCLIHSSLNITGFFMLFLCHLSLLGFILNIFFYCWRLSSKYFRNHPLSNPNLICFILLNLYFHLNLKLYIFHFGDNILTNIWDNNHLYLVVSSEYLLVCILKTEWNILLFN